MAPPPYQRIHPKTLAAKSSKRIVDLALPRKRCIRFPGVEDRGIVSAEYRTLNVRIMILELKQHCVYVNARVWYDRVASKFLGIGISLGKHTYRRITRIWVTLHSYRVNPVLWVVQWIFSLGVKVEEISAVWRNIWEFICEAVYSRKLISCFFLWITYIS